MSMLEVKNLHTSFFTPSGEVKAVNDLSFTLEKGSVLGIVGKADQGNPSVLTPSCRSSPIPEESFPAL